MHVKRNEVILIEEGGRLKRESVIHTIGRYKEECWRGTKCGRQGLGLLYREGEGYKSD